MSASLSSHIERLNGSNYKEWRLVMRTILLHNDLWQYVSGECKKPEAKPNQSNAQEILDWQKGDEKALAMILVTVRQKQFTHIRNCKSAREAWLKLCEVHKNIGQEKEVCKVLYDIPINAVFMGALVYEWIRRITYYTDFRLSDAIILSMANHFKAHLKTDWFHPNTAWINSFRQRYNLQDCNTKNLSIGYNEALSANIRDIYRYLLPLWKSNKMPELTPTQLRITTTSTQVSGLGSAALTSTQAQIITPVTLAQAATIVNEPFPPPSTIVNFVMEAKQIEDIPEVKPTIEVIEIPDDAESIKKDLGVNGVKISRGTTDFEDSLPSTLCTVNGSTTIPPIKETETDPIFKDSLIDLESYIPTAVCFVPEKIAKNSNNNICRTKLKRKDKRMVQKNLVTKKTKSEENPQQPSLARKFRPKYRLNTPQEAFRCIKMLEDFAMIKENFRLIGLIERLEMVMKCPV